jgi:hypothetical protein
MSKKASSEVDGEVNYVDNNITIRGPAVLLVQQGLGKNQENIWYLDSGATNHISGQWDLFGDLDETVKGQVIFGDTSKVPVKGRGNILIRLKNDDHSYIVDVYYVLAIKHNLLSIGQLLEKGYTLLWRTVI